VAVDIATGAKRSTVHIRAIAAATVFAATLCAAAPFAAAPASADGYGGGTLTLDASTLLPGQRFRLHGTGCAAGATVAVTFDGRRIGTTTAAEDGRFDHVGVVPRETAPGRFTVEVACGDLVQSLVITVPAPTLAGPTSPPAGAASTPMGAVSTPGGTMPRTGAEIGPLVRIAVVLLLAGTGFMFLARRRASARPA
jgi:hypothetical protein